jgi:hypothetical protein
MCYLSDIAEFARPQGAKDKKPRAKRGFKQNLSDMKEAYITPDRVKSRMEQRDRDYQELQRKVPSISKGLRKGALAGGLGAAIPLGLAARNMGSVMSLRDKLLALGTLTGASALLGGVYGAGSAAAKKDFSKLSSNEKKRKALKAAQEEDFKYRTREGRRSQGLI